MKSTTSEGSFYLYGDSLMQRRFISAALLACTSFLTTTHAYAWGAIAVAPDGSSNIAYSYDSPEQAEASALEECGNDCTIQGGHSRKGAFVRARGDRGGGWAFSTDPKEAERLALSSCAKSAKNCRVVSAAWDSGATWAVYAQSPNGGFVASGFAYRDEAVKTALEGCAKHTPTDQTCKINPDFGTNEHAFYVMATDGTHTELGFAASKAAATKTALKSCNDERTGDKPCVVTEIFENTGPTAAPTSMRPLLALAARNKSKQVAANSQNVVHCTYRCTNGDCLIDRDDGKHLRVHLNQQFDPVSQQWVWPTLNGCG